MDLNLAPTQIALLGLLIIVVLGYVFTYFRPGLRQVPGPCMARLTNLWRIAAISDGQYPQKLLKLHQKYGPIVRIGPNHVSINDPEAVPQIYGFNPKYLKGPFYNAMSGRHEGAVLHSLFSEQDPKSHRESKVHVSGRFAMSSVRALEPMAEQHTELFLHLMEEKEGQKVDFGEWLQWYTFDVIAQMSFQRSFGFLEQQKDINGILAALDIAAVYGSIVGCIPWLHNFLVGNDTVVTVVTWLFPKAPNPIKYIFDVTLDAIKKYDDLETSPGERGDFLAWIREEMKKDKSNMTERDLLNHMSSNVLAGSETTAIVMRAVFYNLIKDPVRYKKLQKEIDEASSNGLLSERISFSESLQLPYLQAVIKEALRLSPPLSMPLERLVPAGGDVVCGKNLNAGTTVGISPWLINRATTVFGEDANTFRPERWIEADADQLKVMDKTFMAFGQGSRSCMGKNIALLEISKFVPELLRKFTLEWTSDAPEWKLSTFWFMKQTGVYVRFKSRQSG